MTARKLHVLIVLALLTLAACLPKTSAQLPYSEEPQTTYSFRFGCLSLTVTAPQYIYPEKTVNITTRIEAYDAAIHVNTVNINVYAVKETLEERLVDLMPAQNIDLTVGSSVENTASIVVPTSFSTGKIVGKAVFNWATGLGGTTITYNATPDFTIAYVVDLGVEDLWNKYVNLNNTYNNLTSRYDELAANYTDLKEQYDADQGALTSTRQLMGVLAITTALFLFTTFYLLRKKPSQTW